MLSRSAESLFWIGRYIERAEYTARFTHVHYHLILEIADWSEQASTWKHFLESNGNYTIYTHLYGPLNTPAVLEFLSLNRQNPNSLINLIGMARTNARGVQDQLSSEIWHHLNEFYLSLQGQTPQELRSAPHRLLNHILQTCYTLDGVMGSTMLHDEGWNFYRLGKNVERAGQTARLLDNPVLVKAAPEPGAISEYHACLAILKSASAFEIYRKFYRTQLVPRKIVQFLLFHNRFPRSLRFSANLLRQLLGRLSSSSRRANTRESERLAGQFAADLEFGNLEEVFRMGLSPFLTQVIDHLDRLTNHIARAHFRSEGYSLDLPAPLLHTHRRPALREHETLPHPSKAIVSIRHQFTYTYQSPVSKVSTIIRVAPPQHYGQQRRLDLRWHMDPPADYRHFTDAFGNLVWQLDHEHIEKELGCTVEMRIETQCLYKTDNSLCYQGIGLTESDCTVEPAEFLHMTKLVDSCDAFIKITQRSKERGLTPAELAESFMNQIYAHMHYEPGRTHVDTPASQAFKQSVGVCQDYAHIMLALCRLSGLSARYVSGYLPGEGQMHAWVEVLFPTGPHHIPTWVPYDPTHQCRCDERYSTVAVGRDYQDIAPTSGYYSGDAQNSLVVAVSVTLENHEPDNRWLTPLMMEQQTADTGHASQQ